MISQRASILISYKANSLSNDSSKRDYYIATALYKFLRLNKIKVEIKEYAYSTADVVSTYDWLILVYDPIAKQSEPIISAVNKALDQVVERSMQGVLAVVTNPFSDELPSQWITIRRYDASNPQEETGILKDIWGGLQLAQTPYREQQPQTRLTGSAPQPQLVGAPAAVHASKQLEFSWKASIVTPIVAVLLVTIIAAAIIVPKLLSNSSGQSPTPSPGLVATAQAATQTVARAQTPSPQQQLYNASTNKPSTISGFGDQWNNNGTCARSDGDTYKVSIDQLNSYMPCYEANQSFKNFAYQVTMKIQGYTGGIIFRSDANNANYYRFSVSQDTATPAMDSWVILSCENAPHNCQDNMVSEGRTLDNGSGMVPVTPNKPVTLTIIANGNDITLYVNKTFVAQLHDTSHNAGTIGVYAGASTSASALPTKVVFSNLKVWRLPDPQPSRQTGLG